MKIEPSIPTVNTTNYDIINPPNPPVYRVDPEVWGDPALPEIKTGTKVIDIIKGGIWEHACIAGFMDEDNNDVIDEDEALKITTTQVFFLDKEQHKLAIKSINERMQIFDDLSVPRSDEYYASGNIHVAVLDCFGGGKTHGTIVSNILKHHNPDIAVTRYEYECDKTLTIEVDNCTSCHEKKTQKKTTIYQKISSLAWLSRDICLLGKKYDAINMSLGSVMNYDQINELCNDELRVKITPENIAQYKSQIKKILNKKCRENPDLKFMDPYSKKEKFLADVLADIAIFDSINIPIYVSQSYKTDNHTKETFNLLSLINTAHTVEAGTETTRPLSSSNSFSIDEKTGKKRVAQGIVFDGLIIEKNSTSFATPEFLAKTLRKQ